MPESRKAAKLPWLPLLGEYSEHQRRRNLSRTYIGRCRRILADLEDIAPLDKITDEQINEYLDIVGKVPSTRAGYLSMFKGFFKWAYRTGRVPQDPTATIDRPKLGRRLPRPAKDEDLEEAIAGATPRMRAWLLLGRLQGFRCMEIAGLTRDDIIDTVDPPVIVVNEGKGGHQRALPLHQDVLSALRVHGLPRAGWLFPHAYNPSAHVAPWTVSHAISRYLHHCGIEVTAHQLRHGFATDAYRRSHDLRLVQELLGHTDPATTAIYAAFDQAGAAGVVTSMSLRGGRLGDDGHVHPKQSRKAEEGPAWGVVEGDADAHPLRLFSTADCPGDEFQRPGEDLMPPVVEKDGGSTS